jgi:hypothetical protein
VLGEVVHALELEGVQEEPQHHHVAAHSSRKEYSIVTSYLCNEWLTLFAYSRTASFLNLLYIRLMQW